MALSWQRLAIRTALRTGSRLGALVAFTTELVAPARATAAACDPARIVLTGAPSAAWRAAYDELVAAAAAEGHLWSCAGGDLTIDVDGREGATVRRRDAQGRTAVRRVAGAEDLVTAAEALLAASALSEVTRERAVAHEPAVAPPVRDERPASPVLVRLVRGVEHEPRLLTDVLLGVRYGGALRSVWGAGTLALAVPIDAWSVGAWVRYAIPYVVDPKPPDFSMSDAAFGLSVGRQIVRSGVLELSGVFSPSLGFVSMQGFDEPNLAQGSLLDARLGLALRAVFRWTRRWRGVATLDGEVAPMDAVKARYIDPMLPPLPVWSLGASFGLGAAFL
jgi:hypothetical protein